MNKEQQRKEFEEWASSNTTIGLDLELDSDEVGNYYWDISTYAAWEAWQAAQKELTAVTEQRDRLAETIRKHKETLPFAPQPCDKKLYEALQSITPNHFVDADNMVEITTPDHFPEVGNMIETTTIN
jgi:Fe-S cluster biosynthesis and repair protein YggX